MLQYKTYCGLFLQFICLLFLFSVHPVFASSDPTDSTRVEFIIKGTEEFLTFEVIEKIERWGIVVMDGDTKKTVLYKVIKTATLYDSSYVNDVKQYVSNIKTESKNDAYILDFEQAIIPILEYHPSHIINYENWTFNLRPDLVEPLEIGLVYSLWPLHILHHHLTVSSGLPYSTNPSYHMFAFNYGIGKTVLQNQISCLVLYLNYHSKILERTFIGASDFEHKNTFSLEISGSLWEKKRIFPSSNIRYYFNNAKIKENELKITILFGLNVKI